MTRKQKIYHFVLDGGPGGGKTSALLKSSCELEQKGFLVFVVPEAARLLLSQGISPDSVGSERFQEYILITQIASEKYWRDYAEKEAEKHAKDAVIFYDRGLLTAMAYLGAENDEEVFQNFLQRTVHLSIIEAQARYDGVFDLVTAASGAEEFYVTDEERGESLEEARVLEKRTQNAWLTHPHLRIISNTKDGKQISFEDKKQHLLDEVFFALGLPVPFEIEDKYLLNSFDFNNLEKDYVSVDIEQAYLINDEPGLEERLRKRTFLGTTMYYHTLKQEVKDSSIRIETEDSVSLSEYNKLILRKNPQIETIIKKRFCFLYQNQYFEVDVFAGNKTGLIICEREKTNKNDITLLPDFLDVKRDVTEDPNFKNYNLATY